MSVRAKIIVALAAVAVVTAAAVAAVSAFTAVSAAAEAGDETRKEMKQSFRSNLSEYDAMMELLAQSFSYGEYCVILDGDSPTVNVDYQKIALHDENLIEQLVSFKMLTGTDVIYVDSDEVFFKTEFSSGLGRKSEANFVRRYDGARPEYSDSLKIADGWYYVEFDVQ